MDYCGTDHCLGEKMGDMRPGKPSMSGLSDPNKTDVQPDLRPYHVYSVLFVLQVQ